MLINIADDDALYSLHSDLFTLLELQINNGRRYSVLTSKLYSLLRVLPSVVVLWSFSVHERDKMAIFHTFHADSDEGDPLTPDCVRWRLLTCVLSLRHANGYSMTILGHVSRISYLHLLFLDIHWEMFLFQVVLSMLFTAGLCSRHERWKLRLLDLRSCRHSKSSPSSSSFKFWTSSNNIDWMAGEHTSRQESKRMTPYCSWRQKNKKRTRDHL